MITYLFSPRFLWRIVSLDSPSPGHPWPDCPFCLYVPVLIHAFWYIQLDTRHWHAHTAKCLCACDRDCVVILLSQTSMSLHFPEAFWTSAKTFRFHSRTHSFSLPHSLGNMGRSSSIFLSPQSPSGLQPLAESHPCPSGSLPMVAFVGTSTLAPWMQAQWEIVLACTLWYNNDMLSSDNLKTAGNGVWMNTPDQTSGCCLTLQTSTNTCNVCCRNVPSWSLLTFKINLWNSAAFSPTCFKKSTSLVKEHSDIDGCSRMMCSDEQLWCPCKGLLIVQHSWVCVNN